ncbi:MAG: hypothetical protein WCI49_08930 [Ferruginibacter sp.]
MKRILQFIGGILLIASFSFSQTKPVNKSNAGRLSYDIRPWWTAPTGSFAPGKPKQPKS